MKKGAENTSDQTLEIIVLGLKISHLGRKRQLKVPGRRGGG